MGRVGLVMMVCVRMPVVMAVIVVVIVVAGMCMTTGGIVIAGMMVMTVGMPVVLIQSVPVRLPPDVDLHPQPVQPVRGHRPAPDVKGFGQETAEIGLDGRKVRAQAGQRGENHVAAGTADGGETHKPHDEPFRRGPDAAATSRLMRPAATPAPKPLSTLTTVMPAAQELSMASRAARPLSCMP